MRHSLALSQNLEIPRSCRMSLICQTSADLGAEKPSRLPRASSRAAPASQRTSARTSCKAPHRSMGQPESWSNTSCKRRVPGIDRTRMLLLSEGSWSCGEICPSNPNLPQPLNQRRTQQMVPTLCCRTSAKGRHKPLNGHVGHGLRLGSILDGRRFQILRPEAGAGLPWPGASVDSELASGPYLGVRMEYNKQGPAIVASLELN